MEFLTSTKKVLMSDCDHNGKLFYTSFFSSFMDTATLHGDVMGVSAVDLAKLNLFWVITKSKIKFYNRPEMMSDYKVTTWPTPPEILRSLRYASFENEKGVFAEGKTEWIMLKKDTFRPSKTTGVYPKEVTFTNKTILNEPWERFNDDFSVFDKKISYTVKSTDIDLSNHMNNVNYIRALFSCFSTKEIDSLDIKEIEIHYIKQCFEGDELKIRLKNTENGFIAGFINKGDIAVKVKVISSPLAL